MNLLRTQMLAGCALLIAISAPVDAQSRNRTPTPPTIGFGQTVNGRLASAQPDCSIETPASRLFQFTVDAATRIEVTMRADDFDTLVEVGRITDCAFVSMGSNDDGSGPEDGLNSRLTGTLPEAGTYYIRATSFGEGAVGPFQLSLNRLPPLRGAPEPIAIALGQTIEGNLTTEDAVISEPNFEYGIDGSETESIIDGGRAYQLYSLAGNAGDVMQIRMMSEDFDSFLEVGVDSPLGFSVAESNDDGGGPDDGLNSRLTVTFQRAGTLILRVSPLSANNFGAYKLIVETPTAEDENASAVAAEATSDLVAAPTK